MRIISLNGFKKLHSWVFRKQTVFFPGLLSDESLLELSPLLYVACPVRTSFFLLLLILEVFYFPHFMNFFPLLRLKH